jgi:hypothetical protein
VFIPAIVRELLKELRVQLAFAIAEGLPDSGRSDDEAIQCFLCVRKAGAKLHHPRIVRDFAAALTARTPQSAHFETSPQNPYNRPHRAWRVFARARPFCAHKSCAGRKFRKILLLHFLMDDQAKTRHSNGIVALMKLRNRRILYVANCAD